MRRSLLRRLVTVPPAGTRDGFCALLGTPFDDVAAHTASYEFRISHALAERLSDASRPLPTARIWGAVAQPARLIEDFDHPTRRDARLSRLSTALRFLHSHNVLMHSALRYDPAGVASLPPSPSPPPPRPPRPPLSEAAAAAKAKALAQSPARAPGTWNVSPEFGRLALLGEGVLRSDAAVRLHRFFDRGGAASPSLDARLLTEVLAASCGEAAAAALFDRAGLSRLLDAAGRRLVKPTPRMKAHFVLACVGEMHWFIARTKATDRTHNNALFPPSDVLILHVLCCHALEAITAELVVGELLPRAARFARSGAWRNVTESTVEQLRLRPRTVGAHGLTAVPRPFVGSPAVSAVAVVPALLHAQPQRHHIVATVRPQRLNYKHFDKPRFRLPPPTAPRFTVPLAATRSPKPAAAAATTAAATAQ